MMIVAAGMALVVISGKLDISVGSIAYVASAIFALLMRDGEVPFAVGLAAAIGAGLGARRHQRADRRRSCGSTR